MTAAGNHPESAPDSGAPNALDATVSLRLEDAPEIRNALGDTVREYQHAWETRDAPPNISTFLPAEPLALRRLVLFELIKIDLAYRWQHGGAATDARTLEQYASEFAGVIGETGLPFDVVFEEFRLRKEAGEAVRVDEYVDRFPQHAVPLRRCSGNTSVTLSALPIGKASIAVDIEEEIEDFELQQRIGQGAFATVYLARQKSMDRIVALKISSHGSNEPQTLAQLDHPNVIRVYDQRWLPERRMRLLYMEYAPGGTLQSVVAHVQQTRPENRGGDTLLEAVDQSLSLRGNTPRSGPARRRLQELSWDQVVCYVGAQLASALSHAHEKGILHRDIKPANIILAADGTPKLADFNVAYRSKLDGATPAAYFGGSLAYMSPEQLEACNPKHERTPAELDGRSDIYALGTVLWELFTGQRPFADLDVDLDWLSTLSHFTEHRRVGLQRRAAQLDGAPQGLRDILLKCLAPNPQDRYADADQLRRQLELQMTPGLARLLSPPQRSWQNRVLRWPMLSLSLAVLLPNIALGCLNVFYNLSEIIGRSPEFVQMAFADIMTPINLLVWPVTTLVCLVYLWPVVAGASRVRDGTRLDWDDWSRLGPRTLKLSSFATLVVMSAWLFSGVVFPIVMDLTTPGQSIGKDIYLHFFVSQVLHGLIVAPLCFFFVTFLAVRAIYPRFIPEHVADGKAADGELTSLKRRVTAYSIVLGIAPFLAIFALALVGAKQRGYFVLLALLGAVAFLVSLGLKPMIQGDLDRLELAVRPAGDSRERRF